MDICQYIKDRVDPQIKWYDDKSLKCQKIYKRIQVSEIIIAAFIPLLAGYVSYHFTLPILIGVFGVIITILESITKLNKYHELWIEYRTTCELLKYQKYLYETKSAPYNDNGNSFESIFVNNVEQIISSENNQWKIINVKTEKKEKDR